MSYFIFNTNSFNGVFKIAENNYDLNLINGIQQDCYLKIECSVNDFNFVKLGQKTLQPYNGSSLQLIEINNNFTRDKLKNYLKTLKENINYFLQNNLQHPQYQMWLNYYDYLNTVSVDKIIPTEDGTLDISFEEYVNNQNLPTYSMLQLP